ncbi:hypothetical protein [Enterococcus cecorum]|uniref:hypothetical protein n=1 Tax=Enterococcus cecorum TaxID=44008 RepID=UPI0032636412
MTVFCLIYQRLGTILELTSVKLPHPYDFRQEYLAKRDELIAIYLKEKEMIIQTSL